ncbi:hypothetical protein BV20DRAFT_980804 [Pilatotrama ljubarskyi]|nr:hypothetical protein BV20DRAFT_980804 [Pilatotrama ljubarskyi]
MASLASSSSSCVFTLLAVSSSSRPSRQSAYRSWAKRVSRTLVNTYSPDNQHDRGDTLLPYEKRAWRGSAEAPARAWDNVPGETDAVDVRSGAQAEFWLAKYVKEGGSSPTGWNSTRIRLVAEEPGGLAGQAESKRESAAEDPPAWQPLFHLAADMLKSELSRDWNTVLSGSDVQTNAVEVLKHPLGIDAAVERIQHAHSASSSDTDRAKHLSAMTATYAGNAYDMPWQTQSQLIVCCKPGI